MVDNNGVEVEAVFELKRVDDLILAACTPDVLRDLGTAAHHRTIFDAVISFCLAAQGESRDKLRGHPGTLAQPMCADRLTH